MSTNKTSVILLAPLLSLSAGTAIAAPAQQEQLDQSRAQEEARQERLGEERVETIAAPPPSTDLPADESVRFHISQITIENRTERFHFLERIARPYKDKELSLSDINKLIHTMNPSLMARGFSTSRVVVPEQNLSSGELVFLGYPIWWSDIPMPVYTFLDRENFAGKIILPFCTHEGSGLSGTDRTIAETTKADVKDGFALAGHIAQNSPDEARSALYEWMEKQGD